MIGSVRAGVFANGTPKEDPNGFTTAFISSILADIYLRYDLEASNLHRYSSEAARTFKSYRAKDGAYFFWPKNRKFFK